MAETDPIGSASFPTDVDGKWADAMVDAAHEIVAHGAHVLLPGGLTVCAYCARNPSNGHDGACPWLRLARAMDQTDG
jgi:hypothetical protein